MLTLNQLVDLKPRMLIRTRVASQRTSESVPSLRTLDSLPVEQGVPVLGTSLSYLKNHLGDLPGFFEKHGSDAILVNRGPLGGLVLAVGGKELVKQALAGSPKDLISRWPDSVAAGLFPEGKNRSLEESVPWRNVLSAVLKPEVVMRVQLPLVLEAASSAITSCLGKEDVLMYNEVRRIAYTVACKAAVGDILSKEDLEYLFPLACTFGTGVMFPDLGPIGPYKDAMAARQQMWDLLAARISSYLNSLDSVTGGSDDCLLSRLITGLQEEGMLSDSSLSSSPDGELVQTLTLEVIHLVFAGTDTTTTIMASVIQFLCKYPEWLELMWKEQEKLLEEFGPDIDRRVLSRSPMATAFIQEVMRLRFAVPGLQREASEDVVLGDISVPKGTEVQISLAQVSKMTGSGLEEFDPEQWLSEEDSLKKVASNQDSVAFGAGPRNCLGSNLALCELLCTLIVLVRKVQEVQMSEGDRDHVINVFGHPTGMPATLVRR